MNRLRAAVIGAGHLGKFHAQKYANLAEIDLTAIIDNQAIRAQKLAKSFNTQAFTNYQTILNYIDLASIAVPTQQHYPIARECLKAGVHVLIEKPISADIHQAQQLIKLAQKYNCILQVGHSERFHPALQLVHKELQQPLYIESQRLAPFNPRGTDVSVVLDLMIHDIDIILNIVDSPIQQIHAIGIPVVTDKLDIANVRLAFKNGCIANLTASRVSDTSLRKMHLFHHNKYLSLDFNLHKIAIKNFDSENSIHENKLIYRQQLQQYEQVDLILAEIKAFINSISNKTPVQVSGEQALRALKLATLIGKKLTKNKLSSPTRFSLF